VPQDFTLNDFRRQIKHVQKWNMQDLLSHLPGMSDMEDVDPDVALSRMQRIIDAMTDEERNNPDIIGPSRLSHIATSSGTQPRDVEEFLALFQQVRALMHHIANMSLWQRIKLATGFGKLPGKQGGASQGE